MLKMVSEQSRDCLGPSGISAPQVLLMICFSSSMKDKKQAEHPDNCAASRTIRWKGSSNSGFNISSDLNLLRRSFSFTGFLVLIKMCPRTRLRFVAMYLRWFTVHFT